MKALTLAIIAICLINLSYQQNCTTSGYRNNPYFATNQTKGACYVCTFPQVTCDDTTGNFTITDKINTNAYKIENNVITYKCDSSRYFNPETSRCDSWCKEGCKTCLRQTDVCISCEPGYSFVDLMCVPALVGLEAATLALLALVLIFGIMIIVRASGK